MGSASEPTHPVYTTDDFSYTTDASTSTLVDRTVPESKKKSSQSAAKAKRGSESSTRKATKGTRVSEKHTMKKASDSRRRTKNSNSSSKSKTSSKKHATAQSNRASNQKHNAAKKDEASRNQSDESKDVVSVKVIDVSSVSQDVPAAGVSSSPHIKVMSNEDHDIASLDLGAIIAATQTGKGIIVSTEESPSSVRAFENALRESLQKYEAAMRQMEVRFEVLDRDLSLKRNRNPIHHIESRVKKPGSIAEKLQRQGYPISIESMETNLFDIAGVRVICSYVDDVYRLLELLKKQDDLEIVTVKDYIKTPKPNGYRSLHVIVRIPVYFMDKKEMVPVEVQLRTIAMDFWASLEHSLKYKAVREVQGIDASDELKDCSRIIEDVEDRMQILARALEADDEKED